MHDLDGYTIVFTSNAPKEEVREKFPPELLSRFGLKARLAPLSTEDKQAFVRRYIENVATKYQRTRNTLPHPDDVVNAALEGIDVSKEENIRVLKNEARKWFADYIMNAPVFKRHAAPFPRFQVTDNSKHNESTTTLPAYSCRRIQQRRRCARHRPSYT